MSGRKPLQLIGKTFGRLPVGKYHGGVQHSHLD